MKRFTKKQISIAAVVLFLASAILGLVYYYRLSPLSPISSIEVTEYHRILDKYTFARLREKKREPSQILIGKVLKKDPAFTSYLFTFVSDGKTVSGQLNMPASGSNLPVIVMVRGYVDKEIYYTGLGTRPASEVLARAGYITIAPDFLGYGTSDQESFDIFEARFEKPETVLNVIASLSTLPRANPNKIGIWGHSNGGQIALSVLEISEKPYPAVLWAPVTQSFPAAILQYIDELPDKGEYIKTHLDEFHQRYSDTDYDISSHWSEITATLQVHQGEADELVPFTFTQDVVETLKKDGVHVQLFTYPKENHNFNFGSFGTITQRDVAFFNAHLH